MTIQMFYISPYTGKTYCYFFTQKKDEKSIDAERWKIKNNGNKKGKAVCIKGCPQKTSPGLEGLFNFHVQEAEML